MAHQQILAPFNTSSTAKSLLAGHGYISTDKRHGCVRGRALSSTLTMLLKDQNMEKKSGFMKYRNFTWVHHELIKQIDIARGGANIFFLKWSLCKK